MARNGSGGVRGGFWGERAMDGGKIMINLFFIEIFVIFGRN
jgi:hypothetical protein